MKYAVSDIFLCTFFSEITHDWKFWTQEKKSRAHEIPTRKKNWTHKISTRKNTESTKYPQENILDPRNTHEKKFGTPEISTRKYFGSTKYPRRHNGTRPKKTKMARDPRNLAHSIVILSSLLCLLSKSY